MSFFDAASAEQVEEPEPSPPPPPWRKLPCDLLGEAATGPVLLGRARDTTVVLSTVTAYPAGCPFKIALLGRRSTGPPLKIGGWCTRP